MSDVALYSGDRFYRSQFGNGDVSYTVFAKDGIVYADPGFPGGVPYSGIDAATVINQALNGLSAGRTWKERVRVKGKHTITTPILVPSYASLDLFGATLQADSGGLLAATSYYNVLQFGALNGAYSTSEVFGGIIDGNFQSVRGVLFQASGGTLSDSLLWGTKIFNCGRDAGIILEGTDNTVDNCLVDTLTPNLGGTFGGVFTTGITTARCKISNTIVRNGVRNANSTANGFVADDGTTRITWDNCFAYNNAGSGFLLVASPGTHGKEWGIFNCRSMDNLNSSSLPKGIYIQYCDGVQVQNCFTSHNSSAGIWLDNCPEALVSTNVSKNNAVNQSPSPGILYANGLRGNLLGNRCYDDQGSPTQTYGITLDTGASACLVEGNIVSGNTSIGIQVNAGTNHAIRDNPGCNPQGWAVTTPAVPATGIDQQNTTNQQVLVHLTGLGSGVTAVGITDPLGTLQSFTRTGEIGDFYSIDPGGKIRLTYTGSPTWKWYGL